MELWFLHAVLSSIFAGLYSFFLKVSAQKNHNSSLVTTYSMFVCSVIALIFYFPSFNFSDFVFLIFVLSISNGILYFIVTITRIESLRNIDTTLYFPIYKTLGPILVVFASIFIFSEKLTYLEMIGILMGIIVPLLLLSKGESKRQNNMKKGLIYLFIGTVLNIFVAVNSKITIINNLNVLLFVCLQFLAGGLLSIYIYKKSKNKKKNNLDKVKFLGVLNGFFLFLSVYFFVRSTVGNLAVIYTINSFSLLIPILLSIIIYKEHFNLRKALAVVLTLLSLYFFQ